MKILQINFYVSHSNNRDFYQIHFIWNYDFFLASLETEEPAAEDDADLLEHIMVMADCVDQSIQTLRGQLNLIIFNLRTEPASRDKYEKILEMMKNLQYLRITVNRSVRSQSHKSEFSPKCKLFIFILDIAQKDAFTQVQPRHRHVGLQCHMKEKSTLTKMIKSVKKVSTDPERLRKRNGFQIEKYLFFEFL